MMTLELIVGIVCAILCVIFIVIIFEGEFEFIIWLIICGILSGFCLSSYIGDHNRDTFLQKEKTIYINKIQQQGGFTKELSIQFQKELVDHKINPNSIIIDATEPDDTTSTVYIKITDYRTDKYYMDTLPKNK